MSRIYIQNYDSSSLVLVTDRTVVDILTTKDKRTSLDWWTFDDGSADMRPARFAINYAFKKGNRSPFLRGFELNKIQFEIVVDSKEIVPVEYPGFPFYDSDKMEKRFMFEGTTEWFLEEFRREGYKIPKDIK